MRAHGPRRSAAHGIGSGRAAGRPASRAAPVGDRRRSDVARPRTSRGGHPASSSTLVVAVHGRASRPGCARRTPPARSSAAPGCGGASPPARPPRVERGHRRVRAERQRHPDRVHRADRVRLPATGRARAAAHTSGPRRPTAGRTPAARSPRPRTRRSPAISGLVHHLDVLDPVPRRPAAAPRPPSPPPPEPGQHRRRSPRSPIAWNPPCSPALGAVHEMLRDLLGGRRSRARRRPSPSGYGAAQVRGAGPERAVGVQVAAGADARRARRAFAAAINSPQYPYTSRRGRRRAAQRQHGGEVVLARRCRGRRTRAPRAMPSEAACAQRGPLRARRCAGLDRRERVPARHGARRARQRRRVVPAGDRRRRRHGASSAVEHQRRVESTPATGRPAGRRPARSSSAASAAAARSRSDSSQPWPSTHRVGAAARRAPGHRVEQPRRADCARRRGRARAA